MTILWSFSYNFFVQRGPFLWTLDVHSYGPHMSIPMDPRCPFLWTPDVHSYGPQMSIPMDPTHRVVKGLHCILGHITKFSSHSSYSEGGLC